MYAIIKDGGHQYRVQSGQKVRVQLRPTTAGDTITFEQVCLVGGEGPARIGQPFIEGARVEARVVKPLVRGVKLYVSQYKRRKRVRRRIGHRQDFTEVEITGITA